MIFARKQSRYQFCLRSDICSDSDLLIVDIIDKTKSFTKTIQLINIYNEKSLSEDNNERTIERCLHTITPAKYTIICGDMNAHHSWWNSKITNSIRASELVNWLEKYDFELLNKPDILTCSRSNNSIIDLTFAIKELNNMLINWEISEDKVTDSDHETILFSVNIDSDNLVENPVYNNQYNFEKADWKIFAEELILQSNKEEFVSNINISQISREMLETEAEKLRDIIIIAANKAIPKKRIHEKSKSWWNEELKLLRKELANAKRQYKKNQNQTTQQAFQALKADYFYKIKQAKATCWNDFLENAVGKDIFKAFNYTKFNRIEKLSIIQYQHENQEITAITFEQKCEVFMHVLFKKKSNRKASLSKFYRVISLLNFMTKTAEKIIVFRLAYLANITNIINFDQMNSRKQISAIDAVMSLVHDIQLAKNENKITSVLFMNVKRAYDHVSCNQLLKICKNLGLPRSLCS